MGEPHVIIIGGGLAGLSAGCYARGNGLRTTIIEHNLALGGVCTAWQRGPYTIDGCIHWLTGGAFSHIYDELGITAAVPLRTLEQFATYRDLSDGFEVTIGRDLGELVTTLAASAPEDRDELLRIMEGALDIAELDPGVDTPSELSSLRARLASIWNMRHEAGTLIHFRKPLAAWSEQHIKNPRLRRLLCRLAPPDAPAFLLLMILGYLSRGFLSRPRGGTAAFRDALVASYMRLGGDARVHATVDEILVQHDRATGVRLDDGSILPADLVISTASTAETVLRLLGGRYGAPEARHRLEHWKTIEPIVLASFGVATPLASAPQMLLVDGVQPFEVGGHRNDQLYVRVYNDDPCFAPPGHTVVQALLPTDYDFWATRGTRYEAEKDAVAELALERIEACLPGVKQAMRVSDVATPLTYWNAVRSWRGAYEGFMPTPDAFFGHIDKRLPGLSGFYMAGQWVEPGGGVPPALMSGRQVVQLALAEQGREFAPLSAAGAGSASPHTGSPP